MRGVGNGRIGECEVCDVVVLVSVRCVCGGWAVIVCVRMYGEDLCS